MMNKAQFEKEKQRVIGLCSYRPIEGAIRFSNTEGESHFKKKCKICWMLETGWFVDEFGSFWSGICSGIKVIFPRWFKPTWYTEVQFGKVRTDVLVFQPNGIFAVEIVDTEDEKSLIRKEKLYERMGIKMVVVRC